MRTNLFLLLTISLSLLSCGRGTDVCIYGGSSACVTAAYSAAHEGCEVVIICPDKILSLMEKSQRLLSMRILNILWGKMVGMSSREMALMEGLISRLFLLTEPVSSSKARHEENG